MKISKEDLPEVLRSMADYVQHRIDNGEDVSGYFDGITSTGLFHDSEGRITERSSEFVVTEGLSFW